jgi:phosphatidylglycerophosphatase A
MTSPASAARPKPRLAMFVATAAGLGYLPIAPGSWGALGGVAVGLPFANFWWLRAWLAARSGGAFTIFVSPGAPALPLTTVYFAPYLAVLLLVAAVGVWAGERAEQYLGRIDPRVVVVDEVSGQLIAYLGAFDWMRLAHALSAKQPEAVVSAFLAPGLVNWKYLVAGFILFRGFDTWKPFPASRAEGLHGGWGIMADDWIAGIYAALLLLIARRLGF